MTTADLITKICDKFGVSTTDMKARVLTYINFAQQTVASRTESLDYLKSRKYLQCIAPYQVGTITANNGSNSITGSGTLWTSAIVGRKIRIAGRVEFYTIAAVTPDTTLTLDQNFIGTSGAGQTYIIYQDETSLASDVEKIISITHPAANRKLGYISDQDFDSTFPNPQLTGMPYGYTPLGSDSNGYRKIQLYPIPDSAYILPYRYRKALPDLTDSGSSISQIPVKYHELLFLGGIAGAYEWDKKAISATYWAEFDNKIIDMINDLSSDSDDAITTLKSDSNFSVSPTLKLPPTFQN